MPPRLLTALTAVLLAGCATHAGSYFTLAALPAVENSSGATQGGPRQVILTVVSIPDAVDRTEIVLNNGANAVTILENDRWAEPLKGGIERVLVADLAAHLPGATVLPSNALASADAAHVGVEIDDMSAHPGGPVSVHARWRITGANNAAAIPSIGASQSPTGAGVSGIVGAYSGDLDTVAAAIARSLASTPPG